MQIFPSYESFKSAVEQGEQNSAVWCEINADLLTPTLAYYKLKHLSTCSFLLESVEGGETVGRYSILCPCPSAVLSQYYNEPVKLQQLLSNTIKTLEQNPFHALSHFLEKYRINNLSPYFSGGLAGYLSFETIQHIEPSLHQLIQETEPCTSFPQIAFMLADTVLIFDHVLQKIYIVNHQLVINPQDAQQQYQMATDTLKTILEALQAPIEAPILSFAENRTPIHFQSNFTREAWKDAVLKAKNYILEGDIFQTVLSQRFTASVENIDPFKVYRILRNVNPSPYMYFFNFDHFQIVGSSPEAMVTCDNNRHASVRPIAGTRPRGKTVEEDNILAQDLLKDPKELAEHIMLVDLARNDLGKVCQYGSISVPLKMIIEKYSHVMHIVSEVTGQLDNKYNALDLLQATFPAGTVSGAPKLRAMEIIYELEESSRGPYAGCLGFLGFCGDVNTAITIRTMLFHNNKVFVQAGAGIVADSDPDREFDETVNKAKALLETLNKAV